MAISFIPCMYTRNRASCAFRVQVLPSGTFVDKMQDVTFHVGEGAQLEDGLVRIPLYNFVYAKSILQGHARDQLSPVSLSGRHDVGRHPEQHALRFTDRFVPRGDGLSGTWVILARNPASCGGHIPAPTRPCSMSGQSLDGAVVLDFHNPWHALGASIFPLAPGKAHELTLYHDSRAEFLELWKFR